MNIEWKEEYCTGIDAIDKQHWGLMVLLNSFFSDYQVKNNPLAAFDRLAQVNDYASLHFRTEKEIATRAGISEGVWERHEPFHHYYLSRMSAFKKIFDSGEGNISEAVKDMQLFLWGWWHMHLQSRDIVIADVVGLSRQECRYVGQGGI